MVKKEIELIPQQKFDKAVVKNDIILVFKTDRTFLLCDKDYGIRFLDNGFYEVLRVFGGGKVNVDGNCNQNK